MHRKIEASSDITRLLQILHDFFHFQRKLYKWTMFIIQLSKKGRRKALVRDIRRAIYHDDDVIDALVTYQATQNKTRSYFSTFLNASTGLIIIAGQVDTICRRICQIYGGKNKFDLFSLAADDGPMKRLCSSFFPKAVADVKKRPCALTHTAYFGYYIWFCLIELLQIWDLEFVVVDLLEIRQFFLCWLFYQEITYLLSITN